MSDEQIINQENMEERSHAESTDEDFAQLFEQSTQSVKRLEPGQRVTTRVAGISGDFVYIDLGGKSEGIIDRKEFLNEEGTLTLQDGDEIEAYFVTVENGARKFTTLIHSFPSITLQSIKNAFDADIPVTGKVISELKGGYEIRVGKVRCFCPYSQMDLKGSRDAGTYIGETFPFKVLEYKERGRNIILSRRALLEKEAEKEKEKLKESLAVGMEITGKVRSIQKFGVFVDIGGIDGLVPLSELSWIKGSKPADLVSIGDEINARILDLDWTRDRITLSLKAVLPDPFISVPEKYPVDSTVQGVVVRLENFGAFVNLEPGIDGLIPISKLGAGRRINHPKEILEPGQQIEARVVDISVEKRRLTLSMERKIMIEDIDLPSIGTLLETRVERVISSGIIVKIKEGLTGFIPNVEMGTLKGTNHSKMFPVGTTIQAVVVATDPSRGRVSLSRTKVDEKLELDSYTQYRDKVKEEERSDEKLGSLGELLRNKLGL
ncbi:MAG: S1 RNA-binding domain-containing protein [Syntrophorhabdaceae bacterium]